MLTSTRMASASFFMLSMRAPVEVTFWNAWARPVALIFALAMAVSKRSMRPRLSVCSSSSSSSFTASLLALAISLRWPMRTPAMTWALESTSSFSVTNCSEFSLLVTSALLTNASAFALIFGLRSFSHPSRLALLEMATWETPCVAAISLSESRPARNSSSILSQSWVLGFFFVSVGGMFCSGMAEV
ncbi:MAG: hypothetical protein [Bacteriophage sp.]|nr:MAG: hypothetical protein [Bacteriophage sp.]